jgi:alpha-glucosidase
MGAGLLAPHALREEITMLQLPQWIFSIHHDGSEAFVSNPMPKMGEKVTIRLRTGIDSPVHAVFMRAMLDGEFRMVEMQKAHANNAAQFWEGILPIQQPHTDYSFKLMSSEGAYYYTALGASRSDSPDFYDFSIIADYQAPLWIRDAVFYQIFPDRFHNGEESNDVQDGEYEHRGYKAAKRSWGEMPWEWRKAGSMDFFGGDLQGITQKLDYLSDLGVTAIYMTPIFTAESNHKYDVLDYFNVDKHFGGNEALVELRQETEKRGMKLMLDITPNHCSYNHPWVTSFQSNPQTETAEYFFFDDKTNNFETWLGVPSLIKLNYGSQKLREVMYRAENSVIRQWLKPPYSADAWRLDVANMTGNMKEHQLDHDVWTELRAAAKDENPDVYLLGEYFQDGTPHLQGDELDASMNYQGFNLPLRRWLGGEDLGVADGNAYGDTIPMSTEALVQQWMSFLAAIPYPIALQQFNQLDSHDTTRILHVCKGDKELVKLGTAIMVAFPGVPCIYYGSEIGLTGSKDPDNRRTMPWDENQWDKDMMSYFKHLIRLRKESHAMKHGGFKVLHMLGDWLAFARQSGQETVIVVGNRGAETLQGASLKLAEIGLEDGVQLKDLLTDAVLTVEAGCVQLPDVAHGQTMFLQVQ